jgi:acetate---CoA ligase (ADP-forming)
MTASRPHHRTLDALLRPASVAVIGASTDPQKIGGIPISHMKASGYQGQIYPVNPRAQVIQDLPAFPSVGAVPGPVDLAIIAVPEPLVLGALRECAAKGVRAVALFSSGFAEVSSEGEAAQQAMAEIARSSGMRILRPNCIGVVNFANRLVASFHPAFATGLAPAGKVGMVSQSGAFGGIAYQVAADRALAYSVIITTGNESDVDVADGLAYLADDPDTEVILVYMEGASDGRRLKAALERARAARKPVVALKVGRTDAGVAAVASHTAALAGADQVFDAVFRQCGVYRASTMEEFFEVGYAAATRPPPADARVGLVTVSGGVGVLMADHAAARGLDVAPMPEHVQRAIKAEVPFAGTRNPLDVTGQVVSDYGLLERSLDLVIQEGGYPSVICFAGSVGRSPVNGPRFAEVFRRLAKQYPDTLLAVSCLSTPAFRQTLHEAGCLHFEEPAHATRAVAALLSFRHAFAAADGRALAMPERRKLPAAPLDEAQALDILESAGIPVVPHRLVTTADAAAKAAKALGFPVALKIVSPDVTHKTEVGGVTLRLATADEVRRAFDAMMTRVAAAVPQARLKGCLVAPMVSGGVEMILGVQRDPVFGPVVMLGLGGIFVEALKDVTFRAAPFDEAEARRMIEELKALPVLKGVRGQKPADLEALARAVSRLSLFAASQGETLESLDLNPFLVRAEGEGAVALDAVIVPAG